MFVAAALLVPAVAVATRAAAASLAPPLTRYPYLTDVAGRNATVNFGTDQSNDSAVVKWGRVGAESCTAHTTTATKTSIMVNGVGEYQWKALLSPLRPDTAYCYRPYFGTSQIDLLRTDPSPRFATRLPAGSAKPFSFAVIGDWGQTYANGNPDQASIMKQIAASGARFVLGTGDTGYPAGSQTSYGDLQQSGPNISAVFGPRFWPVAGKSVPMFNSIGNHAPTSTFLTEWPANVVTSRPPAGSTRWSPTAASTGSPPRTTGRAGTPSTKATPAFTSSTPPGTPPISARAASTKTTTTHTGHPARSMTNTRGCDTTSPPSPAN